MLEQSEPSQQDNVSYSIDQIAEAPLSHKKAIVDKMVKFHRMGMLDKEPQEMIVKVFREILDGKDIKARQYLAEQIADLGDIPEDIIKRLSLEAPYISAPILQSNPLLSDEDLVKVIENDSCEEILSAIIVREKIGNSVTDLVVRHSHDVEVVIGLLSNMGALISENSYARIVENYHRNDAVMKFLCKRDDLSEPIVEQMANNVSDEIFELMTKHHYETLKMIGPRLTRKASALTAEFVELGVDSEDYELFKTIMAEQNIPESLMPIASLCVGNLDMMEACASRIAGVPLINIKTLVADNSNLGFRAVYDKCKLPEHLYKASEILMTVERDLRDELSNHSIKLPPDLSEKLIAEIRGYCEKNAIVDKNIEYIVSLIKYFTSG